MSISFATSFSSGSYAMTTNGEVWSEILNFHKTSRKLRETVGEGLQVAFLIWACF